jgi:SRSO17 transposase
MNANWPGRLALPAPSLFIPPPSNCVRRIRRAGGPPNTRGPADRRARQPKCWRRITWRNGTKGPLNARFAAVRVRVADGPLNAAGIRLPGEELWLIGEWRDSGETKYYLSNLPKRTTLRRLVATVKARWSCEQVHQQLKQELGLGDFEGRSWTGLHRHALMTGIAFAYLQHRRLKAAGRGKKGGAQRTAAAAIAA